MASDHPQSLRNEIGGLRSAVYIQDATYSPGSPGSVSDITYPSHLSGLESFLEADDPSTGSADMECTGSRIRDQNSLLNYLNQTKAESSDIKSRMNLALSSATSADDLVTKEDPMLKFLRRVSPLDAPMPSTLSSSTSLNESSISLSRLENQQGAPLESFLDSVSEDNDEFQEFLRQTRPSDRILRGDVPWLSQLMESVKGGNPIRDPTLSSAFQAGDVMVSSSPRGEGSYSLGNIEGAAALGTRLLHDVRQRLQLTLAEIPHEMIGNSGSTLQMSNSSVDSVESEIREEEAPGLERPHLDGSSDSEDEVQASVAAVNFARTGLATAHLNPSMMPERELAEGEDLLPGNFGDGGGGGDGSSGHSDGSDLDGDGGVPIRVTRETSRQNQVVGADSPSHFDDRNMSRSRERPVGDSGTTFGVQSTRAVQQASHSTASSSRRDSGVAESGTFEDSQRLTEPATSSNATHELDTQESRLSARYFLAASTPFKADEQTMQGSWMNASSFHLSQMNAQSDDGDQDRTLIGGEFTMQTPTDTMLSRIQRSIDYLSLGAQASPETPVKPGGVTSALTEGRLPGNKFVLSDHADGFSKGSFSSKPCKAVYNPFETASSVNQFDNESLDVFGIKAEDTLSMGSEDFQQSKQDLELLFNEEEKICAMNNNNTVQKDGDCTAASEWSMQSATQHIPSSMLPSPSHATSEDGRISMYFKAKSKDLGYLGSGEDVAKRPHFDDNSHEIVTPPSILPKALHKQVQSQEKDKTIPFDVHVGDWNESRVDAKFDENRWNATFIGFDSKTPKDRLPNTDQGSAFVETPKNLKPDVRSRDASQMPKRQLIGNESPVKRSKADAAPPNAGAMGQGRAVEVQEAEPEMACSTKRGPAELVGEKVDDLNVSVKIPVSEKQANDLLSDIQHGRVSLCGVPSSQLVNLAKCIALLTGNDLWLVLKLIKALIKEEEHLRKENRFSHALSSKDEEPARQDARNLAPTSAKSISSSTSQVTNISSSKNSSKPISSVLPLNADAGQRPVPEGPSPFPDVTVLTGSSISVNSNAAASRDHSRNGGSSFPGAGQPSSTAFMPNMLGRYMPDDDKIFHSTRLTDRFSDPSPLVPQHAMREMRAAASVSPVLRTSESLPHEPSLFLYRTPNNGTQVVDSKGDLVSQSLDFHPLHQQVTGSQFVPLASQQEHFAGNFSNYGPPARKTRALHGSLHELVPGSEFPTGPADLLLSAVVFPKRLVSPGVCCIGQVETLLLPIHNASSEWLQCRLQVTSFTLSGHAIHSQQVSPFIVPTKATVAPHTTEEIPVNFEPFDAGEHRAQIRVSVTRLATEDASLTWTQIPDAVLVEGTADTPAIEVCVDPSLPEVNFGAIPYGASTSRALKLRNKGKANVPVKMQICGSNSSSQLFTFGGSHQSIPSSLSHYVLSTVVQGCKDGKELMVAEIPLKFSAPVRRKCADVIGLPEEYVSRVDIETNCRAISIPLGSVLLRAVVGEARLHSLRTLQAVSLSTVEGLTVTRTIPMRNAGNIPIDLKLTIVGHANHFSVAPAFARLQVQEYLHANVSFAASSVASLESRLLVMIVPDGEQYEWSLRGTSSSRLDVTKPRDVAPVLLCDKPSLNWPGVAIGNSSMQKLILRNNSDSEDVRLTMSIKDNHSSFHIQNNFLLHHKHANLVEATLKPQSELPVHVLFAPSCFAMATSSLVLHTVNGSTKFVVPLSGFGGCGTLDISGVKKTGDQFWIDMGEVYLGKKTVVAVTLRNGGTRAAFVKLIIYKDATNRIVYPSSHVSVVPNEFILIEKTAKQVQIFFQPLQETAVQCQQGSHSAAYLAIYSGEEVLRRAYRRFRSKLPGYDPGFADHLSLDSMFSDEDKVIEDVAYTDVPDWHSFFQASVSKIFVAMVGFPTASGLHGVDATPEARSDKLYKAILHATPVQKIPEKEHAPLPEKNAAPVEKVDVEKEIWSIFPDHIILTASDVPVTQKLQIVNYSNEPLPFEFIWPAQTLVITPSKDKIPPRSQLIVRIDVKPSFVTRHSDLPWKGNIYVQCSGQQKGVAVQIREDLAVDQSPVVGIRPLQVLNPAADVSLVPHKAAKLTADDPVVIVRQQAIAFDATDVGRSSDAVLCFENPLSDSVKWNLSSIAPPYFKSNAENGVISRVTYAAFRIAKHSGSLPPGQSVELPVTFLPRDVGKYSQFWDLQVSQMKSKAQQNTQIELFGQGKMPSEDVRASKEVNAAKSVALVDPAAIPHGEESRPALSDEESVGQSEGVFVQDEVLCFPRTAVGEKSELKFRLCNKSLAVQKVRVSNVDPPFSIVSRHRKLSITPKSYIRVPVYFAPTKNDVSTTSQCIATLITDRGSQLSVRLIGNGYQKSS